MEQDSAEPESRAVARLRGTQTTVELRRIELLTSALQRRRSTN